MFDRVAVGAVGKPVMTILCQKYRGFSTIDDIARAARYDEFIPPEITRLVGKKYKLMVSISKRWKSQKNTDKPSFQVNRIEETFKPVLPPSAFTTVGSAGQSSSNAASGSQSNALPPVTWPSSPTPSVYGSPTAQTPSAVVKLSPSTPAARSVAPKRGTRRSLFNTPSKENVTPSKEQIKPIEAPSSDNDASVGASVGDPGVTTEDNDDQDLSQKSKNTAGDKDDGHKIKRARKNK